MSSHMPRRARRKRGGSAKYWPKASRAGDRLLLCMGLFSIFCLGADAAWLREPCLKPHTPARPWL